MRTTAKTEKEIAEENLWKPGVCDFEVLEAEDTISKASGAEMIKLKVKIFNEDGESQILFDYLLDSMAAKLRHAAAAFGLLGRYEAGGFEAFECVGKTGRCKVSVQKDKTGQFPDKNGIADYILPEKQERPAAPRRMAARTPAPAGDIDDEIPF